VIVEGSYDFPATRETVYDLLEDPHVLVKALPGAKSLVQTGDGTYEGVMSVGVGPVSAAAFDVRVELYDRLRPEKFAMRIDGKGGIGFTRGTATISLDEMNDVTTMHYRADLQVGGRIAGVGQRLLDSASKTMTRQGLEALNRELQARVGSPLSGPSSAFPQSLWSRPLVRLAIVVVVLGVVVFGFCSTRP
jgi:hypothetical protein